MPKRKTDEQMQNEIHRHSKTARELSLQSHEAHLSALNLTDIAEHRKAMQTVIELQRLSIKEMKTVTRLQNVLLKPQSKMMEKEQSLTIVSDLKMI